MNIFVYRNHVDYFSLSSVFPSELHTFIEMGFMK